MLVLAGVVVSSVFGSGGALQLLRLRSERRALGEQAFALLEKNEGLRRKILELRHSDRAIERLARQELGLVREGELVYRFRDRPADPAPPAPGAGATNVTRPR